MAKSKYVTRKCESCGKQDAKMEILGAVEGSETKVWHRCTRCRHSVLIDLGTVKSDDKFLKISREECINYSPEKVYDKGNLIYHTDWDDMGKVVRKEKTSNGTNAIWVSFEKLGEKRLIENLQFED